MAAGIVLFYVAWLRDCAQGPTWVELEQTEKMPGWRPTQAPPRRWSLGVGVWYARSVGYSSAPSAIAAGTPAWMQHTLSRGMRAHWAMSEQVGTVLWCLP